MLKKIADFYQTAAVNDLQCVAYAYRPLAIEMGENNAKFDPSTLEFVTLPVQVLPEVEDAQSEKPSFQNEIQDDVAINEESEKATTSSPLSAGRPKIDVKSLPDPVNIVIDVGGDSDGEDDAQHYGASLDETGLATAKNEAGPLKRWRKLREMDQELDQELDQDQDQNQDHGDDQLKDEAEEDMGPHAPINTQEFFEEAVQGQIFLGMTTLAHQPKTVGFIKNALSSNTSEERSASCCWHTHMITFLGIECL